MVNPLIICQNKKNQPYKWNAPAGVIINYKKIMKSFPSINNNISNTNIFYFSVLLLIAV